MPEGTDGKDKYLQSSKLWSSTSRKEWDKGSCWAKDTSEWSGFFYHNTWVRRSDTKKSRQGACKEKVTVCDNLRAFGLLRSRWLEIHRTSVIFFQVHGEWSVKLMPHSHKVITNISTAGLHLWVCTELADKRAEIGYQGPLELLLLLRAQPVPCIRLFESNASPVTAKDTGALRVTAERSQAGWSSTRRAANWRTALRHQYQRQ